jgi:predicted HAD superfamily Cof-like phosphohydrolase
VALIVEEVFELLDELFTRRFDLIRSMTMERINDSNVDDRGVLLSSVAKELADIAYVVEGSFLEFGINGDEVFDEVHRSNLTKQGSDMRADGKITKGPNYVPPDIDGVLKRQGWNCSNEGEKSK